MPWCPECQKEYGEGTAVCPECGCPLEAGKPRAESPRGEWVDDEPVLLTATNDRLDSQMLEGSLQSAGIPFLAKGHNDAGFMRVYMGGSWTGSDYYVPSRLLDKARGLIPGAASGPSEDAGGAGKSRRPTRPPAAPEEKPRRAGTVLVAVIVALALFGYFCLEALLNFLRGVFGF